MAILFVSYRLHNKNQLSGVNFTLVVILTHFQNYLYNQGGIFQCY